MRCVSSKEFLDIQATKECGFFLNRVHDMITTYNQMHHTSKHSKHNSINCPVRQNGWVFLCKISGSGLESCCSHLKFRYRVYFEKGVLDIQETRECGFTLKCVRNMIQRYSRLQRADKNFYLTSLVKWLSVCLQTKLLWVRVPLQSLKFQISCHFLVSSFLTFRQLESVDSLWNAYVTW